MDTLGHAGLRFPASLLAGFVITGTLFWGLWSLTDHTFEVIAVDQIRIDFTRQEQESPLETRRDPKPERVPPPTDFDVPPIGPPIDTEGGPVVALLPTTVVPVPKGDGITISGSDRGAVPMFRVEAVYPPRAAANGTEGWVLVQFDIGATGAVGNVAVVESEPGTVFDKAATDAVARWRYNPTIVNGQAVEQVGMQTLIRFNLEEE